MTNKLTVVLPVNGRPDFTKRFLNHVSGWPYKLSIAENFGGLPAYYQVMSDAMQRVETPYVMLADNDDFLCREGLDRAIRFLDANPEYVCAGGQTLGFSVSGGCYGRLRRRYRYYIGDSADHGSSAERIRVSGLKLWIYYSVHRTGAMRQIHKEIAKANPDLMLYEAFHVMRALSFGKAHFDKDSISYAKQYGTSTSAGSYKPWTYRSEAHQKLLEHFSLQEKVEVTFNLIAKAYQYNCANRTLQARLARKFPLIAAKWRNRKRFLEWHRAKRQLGVAREFAIIADNIRPSTGRIAAVKHDHHQHFQEIVS